MVRPDGYTKLLDFGLARLQETAVDGRVHRAGIGSGRDRRHRGLHGPRAGARRIGRTRSGHLRIRRHAVRARDRKASVPGLLAARHAARADVGNARAAVARQPRRAAIARSTRARDAAEGSAAPSRRRGSAVPACARARLVGRHGAVVDDGFASRRAHEPCGRRPRPRDGRAAAGVRARAARHGTARRAVGRSGSRQDDPDRRVRADPRGQWRSRARRARALLGAAGRQRSVPPGARGPRQPPAPRAAGQPVAPHPRARAELVRADHAAVGERLVGRPAGRRHRARLAGAAEAGDLGAARRSRAHAPRRPLLRRRALGGPVDDRPARLPGAPHGAHAPAAHRHVPAVRARADAASVPAAEAGPGRARRGAGDLSRARSTKPRSTGTCRFSSPIISFRAASRR